MGSFFGDKDMSPLPPKTAREIENSCGTTCCIAGYAVARFYTAPAPPPESIKEIARGLLRLDCRQAEWLFFGDFAREFLFDISPHHAAAAIDHLLFGGETHNEDGDPTQILIRS